MSSGFLSYDALFWSGGDDGCVRCELCPHRCCIDEGFAGVCGVRENRGGALVASGYGLVSSIALDPIEKKPLYLFHPGKHVLSVGGFGCNLRCPFCQNHEISMFRDIGSIDSFYSPDDIVRLAGQTIIKGNIGLAYTYNEPLIGYEFLCDCARLVHDEGLYNVIVTNGCINREPLEALLPFIDAMNIDLKGFTKGFYDRVGGSLEAVLETIESSCRSCHVEITTLVLPGENEDDIEEISKWLAAIDTNIPLHLSRFFPRYRYADREPTSRETVVRLCDIAKKHLKNVFAGNMG